jgi:hypothetical protein
MAKPIASLFAERFDRLIVARALLGAHRDDAAIAAARPRQATMRVASPADRLPVAPAYAQQVSHTFLSCTFFQARRTSICTRAALMSSGQSPRRIQRRVCNAVPQRVDTEQQ